MTLCGRTPHERPHRRHQVYQPRFYTRVVALAPEAGLNSACPPNCALGLAMPRIGVRTRGVRVVGVRLWRWGCEARRERTACEEAVFGENCNRIDEEYSDWAMC
jgi:hypothetical protein